MHTYTQIHTDIICSIGLTCSLHVELRHNLTMLAGAVVVSVASRFYVTSPHTILPLQWLPIKSRELSLSYYLIHSWWGEVSSVLITAALCASYLQEYWMVILEMWCVSGTSVLRDEPFYTCRHGSDCYVVCNCSIDQSKHDPSQTVRNCLLVAGLLAYMLTCTYDPYQKIWN